MVISITAVNGTQPYKWKKVGKLPKGLKLTKEGLITGTPSVKLLPGSYEITVSVKDSAKKPKHIATRTLTLVIG